MMYNRPAPYIGDPGFFSSVGRALGGVARVVGGIVPGPIGWAAGAVGRLAGGAGPGSSPLGGLPPVPGVNVVPTPGFRGVVQRAIPGGATGYTASACMTKDGRPRRIRKDGKCYKRPTMNPLNPRAARRSIARIKGARRILQAIEREMPHRKTASPRACKCRSR